MCVSVQLCNCARLAKERFLVHFSWEVHPVQTYLEMALKVLTKKFSCPRQRLYLCCSQAMGSTLGYPAKYMHKHYATVALSSCPQRSPNHTSFPTVKFMGWTTPNQDASVHLCLLPRLVHVICFLRVHGPEPVTHGLSSTPLSGIMCGVLCPEKSDSILPCGHVGKCGCNLHVAHSKPMSSQPRCVQI